MNEKDDGLRNEIVGFMKLVDSLAEGLAKTGHPLPKENSKSFYLKCCWVLSWVNKTATRLPDENVLEFRKTMMNLLPLIREAEQKGDISKIKDSYAPIGRL